MSQPFSIGTVTLDTELQWIDEFDQGSDLVGQTETISITGALIIQASAQQAGRAMTLQSGSSGDQFWGPLTRAQVNALKALADVPGATYPVVLSDGRSFTAMFRRAGKAAVTAAPITFYDPPSDSDYYNVTIYLILV
ncbi:MAG: hypothetical protein J0I77_17885 [Rudaea sp.]|uniref:hypothetical protein n=1 Tax=unclassified Rudaea TaxID=2627037 RepID=UPI0010F6E31B|nr:MULTISPECIES: hypothetical protein [unclassified Rudaea]MBN8887600.1 hypothetical protein [Rudaea sp.]